MKVIERMRFMGFPPQFGIPLVFWPVTGENKKNFFLPHLLGVRVGDKNGEIRIMKIAGKQ